MNFIIELKGEYIRHGFVAIYAQVTPYGEFIEYVGDVEDKYFELYGDLTGIVDQYDSIVLDILI